MLRRTMMLVAAVGFATVAGCGSSQDNLVKEMISDMNAVSDAMEKNESEEKVKTLMDKMTATSKKLDELKLSEDDKKKLLEKHKAELEKAGQRFAAAMMKKVFSGGMPGMPNMPMMPGGLGGGAGKFNMPNTPEPGK